MCATKIKYERGRITIGEGVERYILIPMRAYTEIINSLVRLVGDAAGAPLYMLGKGIGHGLAEELRKRMEGKEASVEEFVKVYAGYLEELGFGRIEVKEFTGDSATIYMYEPPSMAGIKLVNGEAKTWLDKGKKICHLEAGMMAAAFEDYLGGKYRGMEVEHGSTDNPYCVIKVVKQG